MMPFPDDIRNATLLGHILRAECRDHNEEWHPSSLYLNHFLVNSFGSFQWDGENFHYSGSDFQLEGSILHGRLSPPTGGSVNASIDLSERIGNRNGKLAYDNCSCFYGIDRRKRLGVSTATVPNAISCERFFEDFQEYEYLPLSKPTSVRLLKIHPPDNNPEILCCSLVEADLNSKPYFVALSYTWQNPFPRSTKDVEERYGRTVTINCNGRRMKIKRNLYDALRRLRNSSPVKEERLDLQKTPLIRQSELGRIDNVEQLLRAGADVHARDQHGETALHYAAENGWLNVVKALIFAGSDLTSMDSSNRTPLDCARERKRREWKEVEAFLIQQMDSSRAIPIGNSCLRSRVTDAEYFWIDAVCMNQKDREERSSQVAMMGDIYTLGQSVIAWLGPSSRDSHDSTEDMLRSVWVLEEARKLDKSLMDQMFDNPEPDIDKFSRYGISGPVSEWVETVGRYGMKAWLLEVPVLLRTYYERAWITQELLLAQDVTIVYGQYILPWDIFILMCHVIDWTRLFLHRGLFPGRSASLDEGRRTLPFLGASLISSEQELQRENRVVILDRRRRIFKLKGKISMVDGILMSRESNASDKLDKVFSMKSFANLGQPTAGRRELVPLDTDYGQTAKELYTRVGKGLWEVLGPDMLSISGVRKESSTIDLPSWVPDLATPSSINVRGIDTKRMHEDHVLNCRTHEFSDVCDDLRTRFGRVSRQNQLFVDAVLMDTVQQVSRTGLNDLGADEAWPDLVFNSNTRAEDYSTILMSTLVQGRTTTLRTENLKQWLLYGAFVSIFGLRPILRSTIMSATEIQLEQVIERHDFRTLDALVRLEGIFSKLGMPLRITDLKNRHDGPAYPLYLHDFYHLWKETAQDGTEFAEALRHVDVSRRLLRTKIANTLGTGPELVVAGDVIVMIRGASVPFVLRRNQEDNYQLLGEAYVYNIDEDAMKCKEWWDEQEKSQLVQTVCIV